MRHLLKKAFLPCLSIIFVLILASCSYKGVTDAQLKKDIEASPYFQDFDMSPLEIHYLVVDKRLTQKETKSDEVWCSVSMSCDAFDRADKLKLTYTKYTEGGWIMDDCEILSTQYTLKEGPGENEKQLAEAAVADRIYYWPSVSITSELVGQDLDALSASYKCTAVYETDLFRFTREFLVPMQWDQTSRWHMTGDYPDELGDNLEILKDLSGSYNISVGSYDYMKFDLECAGVSYRATNVYYRNDNISPYTFGGDMADQSGIFKIYFGGSDGAYIYAENEGSKYFHLYFTVDGTASITSPD